MPHPSTIGTYLLDRLKELGIKHLFGVPGDYNLGFLDAIELAQGMKWIGTCNELNAAYAADGYARLTGVGALVTTMGVGELSAINGIAGSYAEHVPVVQITGVPALHAINAGALVHHTLGDGNLTHFRTMVKEVTVAQTTLVNANPSVSHSLIHIIGHLLTPPVCCRSRSMSDASDLCNPIASGSIFR